MSGFRKIIPFFCVFSILFSLAPVPANAAGSEWGIYSFWDQAFKDFEQWLGLNPEATPAEYEGFGGGARDGGGFMNYWRSDSPTCTSSDAPGGYHYIDPDDRGGGAGVESGENVYMPRCLYCHELFKISGDSIAEAYKNYLNSLENTVVSFGGPGLRCYPSSFVNMAEVSSLSDIQQEPGDWNSSQQTRYFPDPYTMVQTSITGSFYHSYVNVYFQVPVSGNYFISWPANVYSSSSFNILSWGKDQYYGLKYPGSDYSSPAISTQSYYFSSDVIYAFQVYPYASLKYGYLTTHATSVSLIPDESTFSGAVIDASDMNSRPTIISGNYGIIGDDGQIIKVDTSTIINETNNTYTNPSAGTTSTITDWTYDYSDRSYNVTLESGDTVTVTYGDEVILIQEGDTTYNIYYITQGTGGGGEEEPGTDTCQHTYSSSVTREPTCTVPGQTTYTCSLCGHTYTESIPSTGHTWTVLQSVTTEYDQEGNLIQQGYTLYQCSICGEQYKDEDGTGPPGSGEDGGGESIWDKLGNFLGGLFGGVIGIIEAVLGKILDALAALTAMIAERLAAVVELVLSFFDEIPHLFVGFLGFLGALFPFLPEEVMLLLTFGIAVLVFIGIIKALRR